MPAVPGSIYQQGSQPTCFDKMKYGENLRNFDVCLHFPDLFAHFTDLL